MIINCPNCSGVLMKTKSEQVDHFSCQFRCPHCKHNFECVIKTEIVVLMTEVETDGRPRSDQVKIEGLGKKANIRTV